jgi:hypothetical protein
MITAQEARKMTDENEYFCQFWKEVDKKIREAAATGLESAVYEPDFIITKEKFAVTIAPKLRTLGFQAAFFPGLNLLKIMW